MATAQPAAFAHLLLHLLEARNEVRTRWEIAHLWFEREEVTAIEVPALVTRCRHSGRRGLLQRAEVAVELADGDARLRARLERAERVPVAD